MNSTPLSCPKCGSEMRSYERNGVVVDQCTECKGLFLDRGELERLTEAEGSHYGDTGGGGDRGGKQEEKPRGKSKRRSFLEGLFEGE